MRHTHCSNDSGAAVSRASVFIRSIIIRRWIVKDFLGTFVSSKTGKLLLANVVCTVFRDS